MSFLLPAAYSVQAALSAYGLYFSFIAITNVRQYEEQTERAARYSGTAAHQLRKTRTTQASGVFAFLLSIGCTYFLLYPMRPIFGAGICASNVLHLLATKRFIANFWRPKGKVPFVEGYNNAITATDVVRTVMGWLAVNWAVIGFVKWFGFA
ncbi:hypothetical protein M501DRAFT_995168 [Patellaria atrata CBS 101060]|uniref:Uncharacterized protein n=1 Tax=Patellaria atrata CBS 101060 TaxID=1346257 RepID=A0A9P4S891_9PEZI|nr:hypothetical protein M501DRAFT_995168 [Patellaria atrata CBS 101060]